jgi:hypothetical protein
METFGDDINDDTLDNARPYLIGKAAAVVNEKKRPWPGLRFYGWLEVFTIVNLIHFL